MGLPLSSTTAYVKEKYLGPISASNFSRQMDILTGISREPGHGSLEAEQWSSACMCIPVGFAVLLCWGTHFGVTRSNRENVSVKARGGDGNGGGRKMQLEWSEQRKANLCRCR